jgi:hypothetical protein
MFYRLHTLFWLVEQLALLPEPVSPSMLRHYVLIVPGKLDRSVFSTDHHPGDRWIMWAGTPYEHLMVPGLRPAERGTPSVRWSPWSSSLLPLPAGGLACIRLRLEELFFVALGGIGCG